MTRSLFTKFRAFRSDREGTVAMVFSLSFLPMILFTGFAIDYGRAITVGARVQSALDATLLDAVAETSNVQVSRATTILSGTLAGAPFTIASQGFTVNADGSLSGSVTVNLPMTVMSIVTPSISITRSGSVAPASPGSAGTAGATENSCIFTMGEDLEVSNDTMTFNGSPNVNLTGCTLRSNKSMKCNGGATGAQTYAVGSIVGCSYPHSGQPGRRTFTRASPAIFRKSAARTPADMPGPRTEVFPRLSRTRSFPSAGRATRKSTFAET